MSADANYCCNFSRRFLCVLINFINIFVRSLQILTNIMCFIKNNNRLLGQFLGDLFCNFRIKKIIVAIYNCMSLHYLKTHKVL